MSLFLKYAALLERAANVQEPSSVHALSGWELELAAPPEPHSVVRVTDPYGDAALAFRMGDMHTVLVFPMQNDLVFVEATIDEYQIVSDEWHRVFHWGKEGIPKHVLDAFMKL